MHRYLRLTFWTFAVLVFLAVPRSARAQSACADCDPYSSSCGETCYYCTIPHIDNECGNDIAYSTCGDYAGACLQDDCTPDWEETSRANRGTYGNGSMFSCSHHSVDWVTQTDYNHCTLNSYYWTRSFCDDHVDGGKSGYYPDCCDGYGPYGLDPLYTCDHHHYC
jgi:hypothetical protein